MVRGNEWSSLQLSTCETDWQNCLPEPGWTHLELVHLLPLSVCVHLEVLPLRLEAVGGQLGLLQLVLQVVQLVQQLLLVSLDLKGRRPDERCF